MINGVQNLKKKDGRWRLTFIFLKIVVIRETIVRNEDLLSGSARKKNIGVEMTATFSNFNSETHLH